MIFRSRLGLRLELFGEIADDVVIFCVDHHQGTGIFGNRHDPQDIEVAERKTVIGHEDFEGCIAVAYQRR